MNDSLSQHFISLFNAYLDGTLSIDKLDGLEQALKQNPQLRHDLNEHIEARKQIRLQGEKAQRETFKNRFKEQDLSKVKPIEQKSQNRLIPMFSNIGKMGLKMASSILILVGLALLLSPILNKENELEVFDDPSISYFRTNSSNEIDKSWKEVLDLFTNKSYDIALQKLDQNSIPEKLINQHFGQYHLMKGVSFFRLGKHELADNALNKIPEPNPYFDQAIWFSLLNAKAGGMEEKYQSLLQLIGNNPRHYRNETAKQWMSEK